jgi:hypothetical protein
LEDVEKQLTGVGSTATAAEQRLAALTEELKAAQAALADVATQQQLATSIADLERKQSLITDNLAARIEQSRTDGDGTAAQAKAQVQQQLDALLSQVKGNEEKQQTQVSQFIKLEGEVSQLKTTVDGLAASAASKSAAEAGPAASSATLDTLRTEMDSKLQKAGVPDDLMWVSASCLKLARSVSQSPSGSGCTPMTVANYWVSYVLYCMLEMSVPQCDRTAVCHCPAGAR